MTESLHWRRLIHPHRSLPGRGFTALMAGLVVISFLSGVVFVSIGAWPVVGFFGLDVALVYLAFRINYRGARLSERLELSDERFCIERIDDRGRRRRWEFQPLWLRVELQTRPNANDRLVLRSHGKSLAIAGFLAPEDRRALADEIAAELGKWRRSFVVAED